jgi:hypothetical protein
MLIIPALESLRKEDPEFEVSLGHIVRSYLKIYIYNVYLYQV